MAIKKKATITLLLLLVLNMMCFAQAWQTKAIKRIENTEKSFYFTFIDSSSAYIQKQNVSYIVTLPSNNVQIGYLYEGGTSRIITVQSNILTQPVISSNTALADTLNYWLGFPSTGGGSGGIESIVAGTNIAVDATDPLNPIVSATGSTPQSAINVTYNELYDLYSNSQLVPLAYYKITDFQTIYNQTGTGDLKTSSVEELIVQASGTTSLFPNAISAEFPTDEIVYDITYTNTYLTSDSAKGKIIFRKNLNGVSAPFDFRKVLMYDARSTSENLFYKNPDVSDIASDIASYPSTMSSVFSVEFPASSIGGITSQTSNNFYYDTRVSGDLNQSSNNVFINNSFTNVDQVSSSIFFESSFADDVMQVSSSIFTRSQFAGHISQMTNMQIEDCGVTGSTDYCTSSSWSNTTFGENVNMVIASNFSNSNIGDRIDRVFNTAVLNTTIGKRFYWNQNLAVFNSIIDGNAQGLTQHTITVDTINCNIENITGVSMSNSKFGFANCKIDGTSISSTFGNITVQTLVSGKRITEADYPILFNTEVHKTIYKKPNGSIWFYYIDDTNTFIFTEIL